MVMPVLLVEVHKKSSWLLSQVTQNKASTFLQTSNIVRAVSKEKASTTVMLTFPSKIYMVFQNRIHF